MARATQAKGLPEKAKERLDEAKKDLDRLVKEIAPFQEHRKLRRVSTDGTWRETSEIAP